MKTCRKCGIAKELVDFEKAKQNKDGLNGQCRVCVAERKKAYYEANKEKITEKTKAYYEANKEKIVEQKKAYSEVYYEANKEKIAEQTKVYYEANKEKIAEQTKVYYEANKEKIVEQKKAYNEANKEKIKAYREANKEKMKAYDKAYREANKEEHIEELKQIIKPNTDEKWIYVLQCGVYNKIGISNDPLRRIPELEKKTGLEIKLLYLAKANHGRTIDTETIIHHDLKHINIPIPYKTKQVSREWFYGDLSEMLEVISKYAEVKKVL